MAVALAAHQIGPDLIPRNIGVEHLLRRAAQFLTHGNDRRHEHGAGMTTQRHVVVIERVSRHTVQKRGFRRRGARRAEPELTGAGRQGRQCR